MSNSAEEFAKAREATHRPAGLLSTEMSKKVRFLNMVVDANTGGIASVYGTKDPGKDA